MTSLIYDKRHFELSTGDVITNIAVSFSLRFAKNMLNMPLGTFQNALSSICRVIRFYIIFQAFFCFLMTFLHYLIYVQYV